MPVPVATYLVLSPGTDTSNLTTPVFAPANGDVIVTKLTTWDATNPMGAVSGGAQTYRTDAIGPVAGFRGYCRIDTTTVAGTPAPFAVTALGTAAPSRHSMVVEHWSAGAFLAATPATNAVTNGTGAPPQANITTVGTNSVLTWCSVDLNSLDPAGRAYLLSATEDGIFDGHIGTNSVQYFAYANVGAPGVYTIGMTLPTPQIWSMTGIEIQFLAPSEGNPVAVHRPPRRRRTRRPAIIVVGEGAPPPPPTPADVEWCPSTPITGWAAGEVTTDWVASGPDTNWRALTPEEDC